MPNLFVVCYRKKDGRKRKLVRNTERYLHLLDIDGKIKQIMSSRSNAFWGNCTYNITIVKQIHIY